MIEDLWHALLAWGLGVLQAINNLHRQYGLWQVIEHWKAVLCAFLLFVLAAYGGGHLYRKLSRHRLLANANAALQHDDLRGAAIFATRLLRDDPDNAAACKVMAQAMERNRPHDALYWHARVDTLQPGDVGNCLAWARTALELGDSSLARNALEKIHPTPTNLAEYQWLAGKVAQSQNELEESSAYLEKAVALSHGKADYAFDLAKVRLLLPGNARELGRQELESLAGDPHFRLEALQTLFRDAIRHHQAPHAFDYFAQLRNEPAVLPVDRMLYLNFLLHLHHPTLMSEMRDYEKSVRTPETAASLIFWMNANDMSLVAIDWAGTLPPTLQANNAVQLSLAECYASLRDWTRLKPFLSDKNWKNLDFMRVALLARCFGEEGDAQQSQDQWNLAILKATDHPAELARLCEAALDWGWRWEAEAEDLAWRVVDAPHPPAAVLDALEERFMTQGDTEKLYRLLARRRELDPADRAVRNNFALVSLLLKKNEKEARELAKNVYEEDPSDARTGSTYALSLYLQGDKTEALNVMSHFGDQLRIPSVAVYNGIFLAACGEPEQAREFLQIAKRTQLLPEEQRLADEAEASIGNAGPALLKTGTAR